MAIHLIPKFPQEPRSRRVHRVISDAAHCDRQILVVLAVSLKVCLQNLVSVFVQQNVVERADAHDPVLRLCKRGTALVARAYAMFLRGIDPVEHRHPKAHRCFGFREARRAQKPQGARQVRPVEDLQTQCRGNDPSKEHKGHNQKPATVEEHVLDALAA